MDFYREMDAYHARFDKLKNKPNLKTYIVRYGLDGTFTKEVMAANKQDARVLARVGRIRSITLA